MTNVNQKLLLLRQKKCGEPVRDKYREIKKENMYE